ncbi:MAG TPA: flagellar biosynthesis protein FlhA [Polyangia bacterium]|nr:flagellar biosynthesis protein FlhA [Polyangia bacterium]
MNGKGGGGADSGGGFVALLRAGDVRTLLARHSDLALAGLVVAIVGMMIVPLPTPLLDLLISVNIATGVVLLLVAIYVSDALKIATFPTLLLLTTLFRLALEVSATRLILLRADAGEVIHAFGNFVVAGNLVVGAVVFLILTMIQFIVISKGSERVAEVAARFTLDAMPGKQMSIDAELRAGHIDHNEARRRRAALARESQLFGSMDGAMKFVKGDAIAGIVVLAVNIVGGLVIGVLQRGLDVAAAARTYTVLTIGEGLVSQIPALVISTSAGIIVTRVASEEEGGHLGRDIGMQVMAQPKAIAIAAGLLALLAVVPGLPGIPFLTLAAVLGLIAWRLLRAPAAGPAEAAAVLSPGAGGRAAAGRSGEPALPPVLTPIAVEVSDELGALIGPRGPGDPGPFTTEIVPRVRERLFAEMGLALPVVRLRAGVAGLPPTAFVIRLNEVPLGRGDIPRDDWADAGARLGDEVLALVRRYGHELFGLEETQALLDALERTHPALVREVVPKLISPVLLTDVLRRLVEEGISLRNLPDILGALAEWAPQERDAVALTEHVRVALRRAITYKHAGDAGVLAAYLLDPMIEDAIREGIQKTPTGSYLALEPQISRDIIAAVRRALGPEGSNGAVLLTGVEIRRYVRRLVEVEHPNLAVLSFQELAPEAQIRPIARISVG